MQTKITPLALGLFALFLLGLKPGSVLAQSYNFKRFTAANGLGSASVNHIFQDSKGYVWLATQGGGVSRFNGKKFKNFNQTAGLISNDATYVTEDKQGNIWVATSTGVSMLPPHLQKSTTGELFTNFNAASGLTDAIVYCIYPDGNHMYFATETDGVKVLNTATQFFTSLPHIPAGEVYTIAKDKNNALYFGLANGVVKYTGGKVTAITGTTGKSFFSSLCDAQGNIWLGSMTGDVVVLNTRGDTKTVSLPTPCQNDFIGGISQDKNGNIWLATDHGLLKYNGTNFKLFTEREGLSINTVQAVMCDYENNVWAGTLSGGANLLAAEEFVHFTAKEGLLNQNITAICKAGNSHEYFIGTDEGVYTFTANRFKKLPLKEIEQESIYSLSTDKQGNLWITGQRGVFVLEEKARKLYVKKRYTHLNGSHIITPVKAIHDANGNCWIATYGSGVFLINANTTRVFNTQNGFASNKILTVFEDSKSNIWFGTQDAGVLRYDGKRFSTPVLNGLPKSRGSKTAVWSIAEDAAGNMYFGTGEDGLCVYHRGGTKWYTVKDGLSSNYLPVLLYDKYQNCMWAAGEKGLDKLCFQQGVQLAQVKNYNEQNGFSSSPINANGVMFGESAVLWLGTTNGLWSFNTKEENAKNTAPKILLSSIRLFYGKEDISKYYTGTGKLVLPHNKNYLTFDLHALTTNNVYYQVKLQGQDDDWSPPTQNTEITYSNIASGKTYTFMAKAVNNNGTESSEPVLFSFTVSAPWWRTGWFYALLTALFAGGLYAIIIARERVLREQNATLEATVQQRTHEMELQKQKVEKMLSEKELLLKEVHHRVKNNLQTISSMLMLQNEGLKDEEAKKAITESQSRVQSISLVHQKLYQTEGLDKVELGGLVNSLAEHIQSLYHSQANHVTIHTEIPEILILMDKATPLGLIINELLTNSLKHAFAHVTEGQIFISAQAVPTPNQTRQIHLTYRDTGPGFNYKQHPETPHSLGLQLVQLLAEQIGATITYSNINPDYALEK